MDYAADCSMDEAAIGEYEYLAFKLPEFYLRRLKKECIDKSITLNQKVVDIVGNAVKNWPEEAREEQKLSYKRVTVKVPKEIYNKLNARKEETTVSIRSLVMYLLALHYYGPETVYEAVFGDTLPPYPIYKTHLHKSPHIANRLASMPFDDYVLFSRAMNFINGI